jgi:predicted ester cyclase
MDRYNVSAARRWFDEVWNNKAPGAIEAMMPAHCVGHTEAGPVIGPGAFAQLHASFVAALPDLHFTIEAAISEGDLVAVRWRAVGTHSGAAFGMVPTGRTIEVRGCTWQRYEGGEMVEGWDFYNLGGLLTELAGGSV